MCGICGIVRFAGAPLDRVAVERACAALAHRGPDHTGIWFNRADHPTLALGATRLAVMDPGPPAHQPMHDPTGRFHLVYNGEIYNFVELRRELSDAGHRFMTRGDTEVLLAACIHWGVDALNRLNGMWAFAFYDDGSQSGFLSRDRFGVKPLMYAASDQSLIFASELKGLFTLGSFDRSIDGDALIQHLRYGYIAHPATIYRGARRLPPGHFLSFNSAGALEPRRYYEPPTTVVSSPATEPIAHDAQDYAQKRAEVRRTLSDAVVCRRASDVPIGAFLSGGLDSSIIVAHLAEVSTQPVRTFSVGYAGHSQYDETASARLVARHFRTDHHEQCFTDRDVLNAIPEVLDHLGEPFGDSSIIPTALVSRFARQTVTVALSGDGGDELFGGYWRYLAHLAFLQYHRLPQFVRQRLIEPLALRGSASKSSASGNRLRQFRKLLRAKNSDPLLRHLSWSRIVAPEAESLFTDHSAVAAFEDRLQESARRDTALAPGDELNGIMGFDLRHSLPADMLHKVDLASMMHSLEVRTPFLDYRVVEKASRLPLAFKINGGRRKRILIDAYRGFLPDDVLERGKQGFEVPIGEYLRGPLRDLFHNVVTPKAIQSFGILSHAAVQTIYNDHAARRGEHADLLFALLSLCWWLKN